MNMLLLMDTWLGRVIRALCVAALLGLLVLLTINVLGRVTSRWSVVWFDEMVTLLFAWMVFLGAAELWRVRAHFTIDLLPIALEGRLAGRLLDTFIAMAGLVFALALLVYGWQFMARTTQTTATLQMPQWWTYACLPIAGFIMSLYALRDLWFAASGRGPASSLGPGAAPAHRKPSNTNRTTLEMNDHAV